MLGALYSLSTKPDPWKHLHHLDGFVSQYADPFSPDGNLLVGRSEGVMTVWDLRSGEVLSKFKSGLSIVACAAYSSNGRKLASFHQDYTVRIWEAPSGVCLDTFRSGSYDGDVWILDKMYFLPNETLVVSAASVGVS